MNSLTLTLLLVVARMELKEMFIYLRLFGEDKLFCKQFNLNLKEPDTKFQNHILPSFILHISLRCFVMAVSPQVQTNIEISNFTITSILEI